MNLPEQSPPEQDPVVVAQHDETGRIWTGFRSKIPPRYYEVSLAVALFKLKDLPKGAPQ